jgi:hypothetical protein
MGEVHIKRDYRIPAAIQFMNPGAMWPGAIATKWGSTKWQYLSDGTGQGGNGKGNKIAIFDNWVDGICAQLDLWRTSKNYRNKRFADAIRVWSGGNNVPAYIAHVTRLIPSMTADTVMNDAFWRSPDGLRFLQVQAAHEAGRKFPVSQDDWMKAQKRAMSGVPTKDTVKKGAGSIIVGTATGTATGVQSGLSLPTALIIGLVVALAVFLVWKFKPHKENIEVPVVSDPPVGGTS